VEKEPEIKLIPTAYAATNCASECISGPDNDVATLQGIFCVLKNILQPIPALIVLTALFMIIFSGIRIMIAGDDPKALASAWQTFTWAIIGIILLAGAWFILIAIQKFTGANVTELPSFD